MTRLAARGYTSTALRRAGPFVPFFDDFDGSSLDQTKWDTRGYTGWAGLNAFDGTYSPGQVTVHDSTLDIRCEEIATPRPAESDSDPGTTESYRTGMVTSTSHQARGRVWGEARPGARYSFCYGLVEARIKLPVAASGSKLFPAFWMMPVDAAISGMPELDIFEYFGDSAVIGGGVHWNDGGKGTGGSYPAQEYGDTWHTWGLNWRPNYLGFWLDGAEAFNITDPRVPAIPYYIIICMQVGTFGTTGGTTPDTNMLVDWVRVSPPLP